MERCYLLFRQNFTSQIIAFQRLPSIWNLGQGLSKSLPSSSFGLLDLSGNHLTGGIPAMLANCSQLDTIFLNDNRFSGSIPPEIFKSSKLIKIDLGLNQLTGTIPSEVILSTNLQHLGLWNNFLSGNIPKELFNLPNLTHLHLNTNELTGPLPDFPSSCSLSEFLFMRTVCQVLCQLP
uniref:Putative ovule protein n=1 Tax=Solanum chacoense TaxID=4108 RepID=A0A0V0I414_SOLCH